MSGLGDHVQHQRVPHVCLSMFGMVRHTYRTRTQRLHWRRRTMLFVLGFVLCATILVITTIEKFAEVAGSRSPSPASSSASAS